MTQNSMASQIDLGMAAANIASLRLIVEKNRLLPIRRRPETSGQRRPAAVRIPAGGAARGLLLAAARNHVRILPAVLRADAIGLGGSHRAAQAPGRPLPFHCSSGRRVL